MGFAKDDFMTRKEIGVKYDFFFWWTLNTIRLWFMDLVWWGLNFWFLGVNERGTSKTGQILKSLRTLFNQLRLCQPKSFHSSQKVFPVFRITSDLFYLFLIQTLLNAEDDKDNTLTHKFNPSSMSNRMPLQRPRSTTSESKNNNNMLLQVKRKHNVILRLHN